MTQEERAEFIRELSEAMSIRYTRITLTEEEINYVRLAIQREAQSIKLRQSIIDKSLTSLVWAVVLFLGSVLLEYAKSHGYKT